MSSDGKPIVGSRVNQLDAEELDGELFTLFKAKLADVFKHVDGSFYPTYEPEIKAILKALLYGFTVWDCGSTVGQRLLGLEYFAGRGTVKRASRAQILALVSLGTLLPWLRERCLGVGLRRLSYHRRCQVEHGLGHLETAVRVASVANFVLFLLRGTYCSLSARLTGVISGHAQRPMIRESLSTFGGFDARFLGFTPPYIVGRTTDDRRIVVYEDYAPSLRPTDEQQTYNLRRRSRGVGRDATDLGHSSAFAPDDSARNHKYLCRREYLTNATRAVSSLGATEQRLRPSSSWERRRIGDQQRPECWDFYVTYRSPARGTVWIRVLRQRSAGIPAQSVTQKMQHYGLAIWDILLEYTDVFWVPRSNGRLDAWDESPLMVPTTAACAR
ncbi:peroxisome biogenesis factor 2 [Ixodes scapularis]